jgi:uncharacterized protein (DUF305 family)
MHSSTALRTASVLACMTLAIAALPANAQQSASMPGMNMSSSAGSGSGPSTPAFKEAEERMMKGMSAPEYTGDADKDFVSHMIPHHQGAIEMAEVELKYGKDPELKRLAKNIINAQHDEIGFMQRWQAKHGGK